MNRLTFFAVALVSLSIPMACQRETQASGQQPEQPPTATTVEAITVGDQGFQPNHVELSRGKTAVLRFTRTSEHTCATEVVFPELGLKKALPLNQPVDVTIATDQARTLAFQCGMGMYRSQVVIN